MSPKEITEYLMQFEKEEKSNFNGTVASRITNKIKSKELFNRYKPYLNSGFYIGLKDWFDENNNVLEQYKAE